jgi:GNAT superfamily N-acetyltransferase
VDVGDPAVAAQVVELQRRAYRVEADLTGIEAIPALHETASQLVGCSEAFLAAYVGDLLSGVISYRIERDRVDIHRLAVEPCIHRRGVGRTLLRHLLSTTSATRAVVSTGSGNKPAARLYLAEGFRLTGEVEVSPRVRLWKFERP